MAERLVRSLAAAVLLTAAATGCAGNARFPGATSDAKTLSGSLSRPTGAGPFPAVVLLHTCGGITFEPGWANWLAAEGYVALLVDSFRARGVMNTCSPSSAGPSTSAIAMDALAALDHLQSLEFVVRDRIAVMGWSYGGSATLAVSAYQEDRLVGLRPPERRFRAAIAFYPWCGSLSTVTMPTLLLLGGADGWTPPEACVARAGWLREGGRAIEWFVYPGAHHGFDQTHLGGGTVSYFGYTLRYDAGVTAKTQGEVRRFLRAHLR